MAVLISNPFTAADGPFTTAGIWTVVNGTWAYASNKLRKTASDLTHQIVYADAGSTHVVVSVSFVAVNNKAGGLVLRLTDADHWWLLQVFPGNSNGLALYEYSVPTFTSRGTPVNYAYSIGTLYTLRAKVQGRSITGEVLDTSGTVLASLSYASASYNETGTKYGIDSYSTGIDWDDFQAESAFVRVRSRRVEGFGSVRIRR